MRAWRRVPALIAAAVLLLGVAATWVGPDSWWSERCPAAEGREQTTTEVSASLWPPGTRCVVTLPGGGEVSRSYVPWREWLLALLAAVVAWVVARPALRRLGLAYR